MFRTFFIALGLAAFTATLTLICLSITPTVNAASVPDSKSCPHSIRSNSGGKIAHQVGPESISKSAGSLSPTDPGFVKLNAGCQPLAAPLPPQGAGKTFNP